MEFKPNFGSKEENPPIRTSQEKTNQAWKSPEADYIDTKSLQGTERDKFIFEYMGLVRIIAAKIARKYSSPEIEFDELVQNGVLGLFDAMSKYDPKEKILFSTFATYRIRGAMLDFIGSHHHLSKKTRHKRDNNVSLDAILKKSDQFVDSKNIRPDEWAHTAGIKEILNQALEEFLQTKSEILYRERFRDIYRKYYVEEKTLEAIAKDIGVNESRVSQLIAELRLGIKKFLLSKGLSIDDIN